MKKMSILFFFWLISDNHILEPSKPIDTVGSIQYLDVNICLGFYSVFSSLRISNMRLRGIDIVIRMDI